MKIVMFSSYNESKLLPITDIVIDEKGIIERVIDNVKSKEHAAQILEIV